ncbi:MAG: hypothetical protein WCL18_05870 [bacterium]
MVLGNLIMGNVLAACNPACDTATQKCKSSQCIAKTQAEMNQSEC